MKFDHRFSLKRAEPSLRVYEADGVTARLDFFSHILRVAILAPNVPLLPTYSVCPNGEPPTEGRDKLSADGFEPAAPQVDLSAAPSARLPCPAAARSARRRAEWSRGTRRRPCRC